MRESEGAAAGRGRPQEQTWEEVILRYGGQLGRLLLGHDWAASPLGPLEDWPDSLRTAVTLCVTARFPAQVFWGPQLVHIYNDAYLPILDPGKHGAALGRPMTEIWPEVAAELGPRLEDVLAGGDPVSFVDHPLHLERSGRMEEVYVTFSYSPIIDPAEPGSIEGVFCAVTETTPHVLYERRAEVLMRLTSELVDLPNATEVCAVAGDILESNASDHPLVSVYEVVDAVPVATRSHPVGPTRQLLTGAAEEALSTGRPVRVDLLAPGDLPPAAAGAPSAGAGAERVRTLHAVPLHLPGSKDASAVLVVGQHVQRSLDEAYEAYVALAALHLRTALSGIHELESERQRHKALQELDAEKSLFYTNISHELRTPLTLIHGPVDSLIRDRATPADVRRQLEIVERNVTRLARMVDAMLDFSRIEAGGIHLALVPMDVTAVTRGLAAAFEAAFSSAGIAFVVDCEELPGRAVLDHDMYERIVLNLLSNALKYTPEGSVTVRLRDLGDRFEVAVADTGVGIRAEDQERIFGRFEQLPKHPRARAHEGAGIGLAMVKQLAELLGGTVRVRSEPDRGSTFTVRLPYQTGPAGAPEPAIRPTVSRRPAPSFLAETTTWRGLERDGAPALSPSSAAPAAAPAAALADARPRLLVADDNADMRDYLVRVLVDYAVEVVTDGQAALDRCREAVPDLVLADVMMPGLDGFGLVRQLRADPSTSEVPIILLSAHAGEEATVAGLEHGADDYVVKPFSVSELRARVASTLERARSRSRDAAWRRAVMTTFHDPLLIAEPSGRIVEVNQAFTELLGWDLSGGPIDLPHPWLTERPPAAGALSSLAESIGHMTRNASFTGEFELRAKDGRRVWVRAAGHQVDGGPESRSLLVVTLRDVTQWHEARARREAAARLSAELGTAEDLDQVLMAAVTGFSELFAGEAVVRAIAGRHDLLFTAPGPARADDLPPDVIEALAGDATAAPLLGPVSGILIAPKTDSAECRAWIGFPQPRPVGADERIVGDLLAQAFALAVDRVVAAGEFADREANLQVAIESHRHIGQAVGILVERHRITPADALTRLKRASQDRNIKLRELASRVIESGAEPADAQ